MIYVKVNDVRYPATISGKKSDMDWNGRESKAITLEMSYADASALFVDNVVWGIVMTKTVQRAKMGKDGEMVLDELLRPVMEDVEVTEEFDNSDYYVAGAITDNRNGTITVKMGKATDGEMLAELMEVLNNEEG